MKYSQHYATIIRRILYLLLPLLIFSLPLEGADKGYSKRWIPPSLEPKLPQPKRLTPLPTTTAPPVQMLLKPESNILIVIDPGHGGKDKGAHAKKPQKYQEKHLTLTTALMLRTYLKRMGYAVLMTRSDDIFISLEQRAAFVNKEQPNILVSLHYNTAPNPQAEGIEVFYFRSNSDKKRTKESEKLAATILKRILINTGAKSRGVKHGNLAVLRETTVPAVLVEGGFLSHAEEVLKIKDGSYLKQLSWGIAQGINEYLGKQH